MDKKLLRKELLAVRQEIAATRPEAAKELARNIVGWLEANPQFSSVGLYYPIQSEPDLMEALGAWQSEKPGRMLALPVVMKGKMGYYQWTRGLRWWKAVSTSWSRKRRFRLCLRCCWLPVSDFPISAAGWVTERAGLTVRCRRSSPRLSRSRCPMRPVTRREGLWLSLMTFCFSGSQPNGMSVRPRSSEDQ